MTHGSNGHNGNGSNGGNGHGAPDALPPAATHFMDDVRAQFDKQAAFFKSVVDMSEAVGAEYLKAVDKLRDAVVARLHQQDADIAALKRRLDRIEAPRAEAEKSEP